MLLIGNGTVITRNDTNQVLPDGCVAIEGESIAAVGKTGAIRKRYPGSHFIDAHGGLIMPGYINAHMHIYSAFARGMFLPGPPNKTFAQILENLWWRLDNALTMDDVRYSAYATYLECIRNGVTTVFDHHASFNATTGSLFAIHGAAKELGVRTSLCYEISDRNGAKKAAEAIRENADFIRFAKAQGPMTGAMCGLHASFTLSDKTLDKCAGEMAGLDVGYHVHTAEGPEDLAQCRREHGMRVVERLNRFGILGKRSIAVHCVHVDEHETELLRQTGTIVVHNPQSNMGNAVGCSRVIEMMSGGVFVGLGTDGYTSDMLSSMKAANLIHKHRMGDPSAAWAEPPGMLFNNNKAIAKRLLGANAGVLKKGAAADVIVADYVPHTPLTAGNVDSHLHFGVSGKDTITTVINGRVLMQDRQVVVADEARLLAEARALAQKLWDRI